MPRNPGTPFTTVFRLLNPPNLPDSSDSLADSSTDSFRRERRAKSMAADSSDSFGTPIRKGFGEGPGIP